jgi:Carboxypeptidase regulatory-like domain
MNATQEAKLNMYRATQKHCNDNPTIIASVPAFKTAIDNLNTIIASIIATAQQQDVITKGIAIDKAQSKKTLCQLAADIAAPIIAFAAANSNNQLLKEVSFTNSDLIRTKDDLLAPRCQNILDAAQANLAALGAYGISAASVATLQSTIKNYQIIVPNPRNAAAQKATINTNLKNLFKEADNILKLQLDKTIVSLKATQPNFVSTYKSNRIILDPSKTTTALKGTIQSSADKSFIAGATILVVETETKVVSNNLGEYEIKPVSIGQYTITVSAPKYNNTTVKEVSIKQGQSNKLDIVLNPA